MVNVAGEHLAGWADPSEEGWQERTKKRVSRDEVIKRSGKGRPSRREALIYTDVDLEFSALLTAAAKSRGMPRASYLRRCLGAFISHDLDLPFEEVMSFCPAVQGSGESLTKGSPTRVGVKSSDSGEGYGSWKVA